MLTSKAPGRRGADGARGVRRHAQSALITSESPINLASPSGSDQPRSHYSEQHVDGTMLLSVQHRGPGARLAKIRIQNTKSSFA